MSRRKSATPKERVLARYPTARAVANGDSSWHICLYRPRGSLHALDDFTPNYPLPRQAWRDAAKRLRGKQ